MKLKYYLRGLGIGIFVTALIMTIATGRKGTMTDDEIIQRATELGMVASSKTLISQQEEGESTQAPQKIETQEPEATLEPTEEPTKEPETTLEPTEEPTKEPETTLEPTEEPTREPETTLESTEEPTEEPAKAPADDLQPGEAVTLTIYSGEHSAAVAKRMEDLGLVDNYLDFDDYLCDNGYSRYVNSGIYKIKQGLSYEELARIITRTN